MHIENVDALKLWLTNHLQPICDADPDALARYVIALVKKDKPTGEVKDICLNQLEVFLAAETTKFVDVLFDALEGKTYLQEDSSTDAPVDVTSSTDRRITHYEAPDDDERDFRRASRSRTDDERVDELIGHSTEPTGIDVVVSSNSRRKRRTEDDGRTGQHDRGSRNRPRTDRRQDRGKNEIKNLTDVGDRDSSTTVNTNNRTSYPPKSKQRCRDYDQKGFCVRGETCPYDHGSDAVVVEDTQQIRLPSSEMLMVNNSDRRSFRVGPSRMQMHNPPPNILPIVRTVPPPIRPSIPPPLPPSVSRLTVPPPPPPRQPILPSSDKGIRYTGTDAYNPEQPSFDGNTMIPPPLWPSRSNQSDISNIKPVPEMRPAFRPTITGGDGNRKRHAEATEEPNQLAPKRRFDYARLGYRSRSKHRDSVTLEIRKIPIELNTITKLNEHFAKFGNIINIQIALGGDRQAALVQFASHEEAKKAHDSPEAVLNNRFIKVFWKSEQQLETERKPDENKDLASSNTPESAAAAEKAVKPAAVPNKFVNPQAFKVSHSLPASEGGKTDVLQKRMELQKQSQELYQKLISQYKLLAEKLNAAKSQKEREFIVQSLKKLNEDIEVVKERLISVPKSRKDAQKALLDKELELLTKQNSGEDTAELERMVELLKKEAHSLGLLDLAPSTLPPGRILRRQLRGRWNPSRFRGRGRGRAVMSSRSVLDNRTTKLNVQGVTIEDKDDVIEHFSQFGSVSDIESGENDQVIVTFETRKAAEIAAVKGVIYKSKSLVFSWHNPKPETKMDVEKSEEKIEETEELTSIADVLPEIVQEQESATKTSDNEGLSSEDSLLLDEDDEADEDRPWRR